MLDDQKMWHLTACKISVSLLFLNWIKNEMALYRFSELMLASLIQRSDKNKIILFLIQLQGLCFWFKVRVHTRQGNVREV